MGDPQRQDARQRISRALVGEDATGVVVEENPLVGEGGEALVGAANRRVVGGEVAGGEARGHPHRCAQVQGQRRGLAQRRGALLRPRPGDLVAPAGGHVESDIRQHVEGGLEALVRVAFLEQRDDEAPALLDQLVFAGCAHTFNRRAVGLGEVQFLEPGVQLNKRAAHPRIEPV